LVISDIDSLPQLGYSFFEYFWALDGRVANRVLFKMTKVDVLLSDQDSESSLSIAFVHAIAAHAGYICGEPPGPDRDSIDLQVSAGGPMRPKLDIQLKATKNLIEHEDAFSFPLKVKNYNDLIAETQTPRILVVMQLHPNTNEWLSRTDEELVLRKSAYWISLKGKTQTENSATVTISIPKTNKFDVKGLQELMEKSRTGGLS
jgi:Domain of unknown function (DUF4365)